MSRDLNTIYSGPGIPFGLCNKFVARRLRRARPLGGKDADRNGRTHAKVVQVCSVGGGARDAGGLLVAVVVKPKPTVLANVRLNDVHCHIPLGQCPTYFTSGSSTLRTGTYATDWSSKIQPDGDAITMQFTLDQLGKQVGTYAIDNHGSLPPQALEAAEWQRSSKIIPGVYAVILNKHQNGFRLVTQIQRNCIEDGSKAVDSDVPIGSDFANANAVDTADADGDLITLAFAYSLDDLRMPERRSLVRA